MCWRRWRGVGASPPSPSSLPTAPNGGKALGRSTKDGGLNAELAAWRAGQGASPLLVIHADLPLLDAGDIADLLDAAEASGIALATDRAGMGSNALAIADGRNFAFCFGVGSRALHVAQAPAMPVLATTGLAADLDTPDDAAFVEARGFTLRSPCQAEGPRDDRPVHA